MSVNGYKVKDLINVHDGDTITLHLDPGLSLCDTEDIRLMGVFAKELDEPGLGAGNAKDEVVTWFVNAPKPWTCYTILTAKGNERMTLGRYVGDVHDANGNSLCTYMMTWLVANPDSFGGTGAPKVVKK